MLAFAMGARNATVRRFGVPDLTTTVLTMTLTGLASDSRLAGGSGKGSVRRIAAVLAMLVGAIAGALLLKTSLAPPLFLAAALALVGGVAYVPLARRRTWRPGYGPRVLGLPSQIRACLFDLDGVLTQTAKIHAAAWQQMFDEYLRERAKQTDEQFVPFDPVADYDEYVDGLPRYDGVRRSSPRAGSSSSREIRATPPAARRSMALGNRKNEILLKLIREQGVEAYEGSVRFVKAAREAGLRRAVVSSSTNCRDVLAAAGIEDLFEAIIDGVVAEREHLAGKPAPDTYLAGARALDVPAAQAAVFEDALAGVEAGRAGSFGCVVGVDRVGQADALREHGADVVVADLAELLERS